MVAVLNAARVGLRGWETEDAPYVLNLCEGMEACPWGMEGGTRPEVERLAEAVLLECAVITGDLEHSVTVGLGETKAKEAGMEVSCEFRPLRFADLSSVN